MEIKTRLLDLLQQAAASEQEFITSLTGAQKTETGAYERWSAKDGLAHVAAWNERLVRRIQLFSRGETIPPTDENQANAEIYAQSQPYPWDEVAARAASARAALLETVGALSEDELLDPRLSPWQNDRPAWINIAGTAFTHPLIHRAQYFADRGQAQLALRAQEMAADQLLQMDDSPTWRGMTLYNLACAYALGGDKEKALTHLREGLELNPGLLEWSKQDTDLVSLHGDPAYRALYQS